MQRGPGLQTASSGARGHHWLGAQPLNPPSSRCHCPCWPPALPARSPPAGCTHHQAPPAGRSWRRSRRMAAWPVLKGRPRRLQKTRSKGGQGSGRVASGMSGGSFSAPLATLPAGRASFCHGGWCGKRGVLSVACSSKPSRRVRPLWWLQLPQLFPNKAGKMELKAFQPGGSSAS